MNVWIIMFVFCRNIYGKKSVELWLVIIGYLVRIVVIVVYFCNGEMDVCYEIKDL